MKGFGMKSGTLKAGNQNSGDKIELEAFIRPS